MFHMQEVDNWGLKTYLLPSLTGIYAQLDARVCTRGIGCRMCTTLPWLHGKQMVGSKVLPWVTHTPRRHGMLWRTHKCAPCDFVARILRGPLARAYIILQLAVLNLRAVESAAQRLTTV